jgi:hypothetical protein
LQDEENVIAISKVYDLFLFDIGDGLRLNSFEEKRDDVILATTPKDSLGVFIGSILRIKTKWIQEEFNRQSQQAWIKNV